MALKFPDILQHNNTNYAIVDANQVRGTAFTLSNLSQTGSSIPDDKRSTGIIVFVVSEQKYYGYFGATTSSNDWNNSVNWKQLADGQNAASLGVITTGSVGTNQTISGSLTVIGGLIGTASFAATSVSASHAITSSYTLRGIITASASGNVITFTKGDGSTFITTITTGSSISELLSNVQNGQIIYNSGSAIAGVPGMFYTNGILTVTGAFNGNLIGTASWAQTASYALTANTSAFAINAATSSYPFIATGSTIYSHHANLSGSVRFNISPDHSFMAGQRAGMDARFVPFLNQQTSQNQHSIFIGYESGFATLTSSYNIFLGNESGKYANNVSQSIFIGSLAGIWSLGANSVFIGRNSGNRAFYANDSVFIGNNAGFRAQNARYSNFIGFQAGLATTNNNSPGPNNTIIGTNITLQPSISNSINLGGIIFASGTYSNPVGNPRSTPVSNGKVGINIYPNDFNFEVNGTTNIRNGLYVSNSFNLSGSSTQFGDALITGSLLISGGNAIISGAIDLVPTQDPDPTGANLTDSFLFVSASNTALGYDLYIRQDGNLVKLKWFEGILNTGILYGGTLSYSGSTNQFTISSGSGIIIDHNATTGSEISPMIAYVKWPTQTLSVTNITSSQNTYVYIGTDGSVNQQTTFFTPEQYNYYLPIGRVSHYNKSTINGVVGNIVTSYDIDSQQNVLVRALGPLKLSGFDISGQTGTLRLNVASGEAFNLGGFYQYNQDFPSTYVQNNSFPTASIIRIYRSGSSYIFNDNGGAYWTTIDPANYDNGTGVLQSVGNNNWSIQRVMVNPISGRAHVYYGQSVYSTYDLAVSNLSSDPFSEDSSTKNSYVLAAYLIVRGNATNLLDTSNNKIIQGPLFRAAVGVGGGGTGGAAATALASLTDVTITSPLNRQSLVYDANNGKWVNSYSISGSLTGSLLGTASLALTASFVTSSNVFGPNGANSILTASFAATAANATSASFATTASFALNAGVSTPFPFSGSAIITGSLLVSGSGIVVTGSVNVLSGITGSLFGTASFASTASFVAGYVAGNGGVGQIAYWTGTNSQTGSSNLFWDNTNRRVGIGTNVPSFSIHLNDESNVESFNIFKFSSATSGGLAVSRARGTQAAPTAVLTNDGLLTIAGRGYRTAGGNAYNVYSTAINFIAGEDYTSTANGSYITFETTQNATTTRSERLRILGNGNVLIGTNTDGGFRLDVNGTTRLQNTLTVSAGGANLTGNTNIVGNLSSSGLVNISSTPTVLSVTGSGFLVTQQLSQSSTVGSQIYGVNISPIMFGTTGSQTETAFRVAPTFTGSALATASVNIIADFGAVNVGSQLVVNDIVSGSIYMVNDISGLPIIEATSDWTVNMYDFPSRVFRKTGSIIELGILSSTASSVNFLADTILNEGVGVVYRTTQASGSTFGAVTSSLWRLLQTATSSVFVQATVTGFDTGSRDTIGGDIKGVIKFNAGTASFVGTPTSYSVSDNPGVGFALVAGNRSGSLLVYGTGSRAYQWAATVITQIV
ncbi:hypothetical protein UFOVP449_94 [uncultured Caudovirales phage]|uniref:Uncharacterized protein n=1 Tax=uncultured Caudovirales phage TaxID=2100421 RepID=A0A6J5MDA6_9CAUD|nr:hypothetical protein UFOVP449_94 [uncultured Caudovirales phage]